MNFRVPLCPWLNWFQICNQLYTLCSSRNRENIQYNIKCRLACPRPPISAAAGATRTIQRAAVIKTVITGCMKALVFLQKAKPASIYSPRVHMKSWNSRLCSSSPTVILSPLFVFLLSKCQRGSALIIRGEREELCWTPLRSKNQCEKEEKVVEEARVVFASVRVWACACIS